MSNYQETLKPRNRVCAADEVEWIKNERGPGAHQLHEDGECI